MTTRYYLKDHSLTEEELARFKSALQAFGATLEATDADDDGGLIRLIAPAHAEAIQVTVSEEGTAKVEHACNHFGFRFSTEPPPVTGPAKVDMLI